MAVNINLDDALARLSLEELESAGSGSRMLADQSQMSGDCSGRSLRVSVHVSIELSEDDVKKRISRLLESDVHVMCVNKSKYSFSHSKPL